jgi:hypothetical protein
MEKTKEGTRILREAAKALASPGRGLLATRFGNFVKDQTKDRYLEDEVWDRVSLKLGAGDEGNLGKTTGTLIYELKTKREFLEILRRA